MPPMVGAKEIALLKRIGGRNAYHLLSHAGMNGSIQVSRAVKLQETLLEQSNAQRLFEETAQMG